MASSLVDKACTECGGTGDGWDHDKDDWKSPQEPCAPCLGTGDYDVQIAPSPVDQDIKDLKVTLARTSHGQGRF